MPDNTPSKKMRVRVDPPPVYFDVDVSWPGMVDKTYSEQENYALNVAHERYADMLSDARNRLEQPRLVRVVDVIEGED